MEDTATKIRVSKFYPNRKNQNTELIVELKEATQMQIQLNTEAGRVIWAYEKQSYRAGLHTIQLNLETLPSGTYYVEVITDLGKVRKVLKKLMNSIEETQR